MYRLGLISSETRKHWQTEYSTCSFEHRMLQNYQKKVKKIVFFFQKKFKREERLFPHLVDDALSKEEILIYGI